VEVPSPAGAAVEPFEAFRRSDLLSWVAEAGLPPPARDTIRNLQPSFNRTASLFLVRRQLADSASMGEVKVWARQIEEYAKSLLFALGCNPDEAPLLGRLHGEQRRWLHPGPTPVPPISEQAFRALPFPLSAGIMNRDLPVSGPGFSPWPIIEAAPALIGALMLSARLAAQQAEARIQGGAPAEAGRAEMFAETIGLYEALTGRPAGVSRREVEDGKGQSRQEARGPCVAFHQAMLATFREKLAPFAVEQDPGLSAALTMSTGQIAEAINAARKARKAAEEMWETPTNE
jgi:hypothetical protein